jgi:hypothetical protein
MKILLSLNSAPNPETLQTRRQKLHFLSSRQDVIQSSCHPQNIIVFVRPEKFAVATKQFSNISCIKRKRVYFFMLSSEICSNSSKWEGTKGNLSLQVSQDSRKIERELYVWEESNYNFLSAFLCIYGWSCLCILNFLHFPFIFHVLCCVCTNCGDIIRN